MHPPQERSDRLIREGDCSCRRPRPSSPGASMAVRTKSPGSELPGLQLRLGPLLGALTLLDEALDFLSALAPDLLVELRAMALRRHLAAFAAGLTDCHRPSV